jgi:hypothetical protein
MRYPNSMRFSPQFVPKILSGAKKQTFHLKPVPVGTVLHMEADGDLFATATVATCEPCLIERRGTLAFVGGKVTPVQEIAERLCYPSMDAMLDHMRSAYQVTDAYHGYLVSWGEVMTYRKELDANANNTTETL